MAERVVVYGADWCGDTRRAKRHLERTGVQYEFVDVDENEDAERKVIQFNSGKRRIPLVEVTGAAGTESLSVPSESELDRAVGGGRREPRH